MQHATLMREGPLLRPGAASSWVAFDARGGGGGASGAAPAASGFGSAAFGGGGSLDGGSTDGFTPKEAAFGGGPFSRAETSSRCSRCPYPNLLLSLNLFSVSELQVRIQEV